MKEKEWKKNTQKTKINIIKKKKQYKLYEITDVPSDRRSRSRAYAHDNDLSALIVVA